MKQITTVEDLYNDSRFLLRKGQSEVLIKECNGKVQIIANRYETGILVSDPVVIQKLVDIMLINFKEASITDTVIDKGYLEVDIPFIKVTEAVLDDAEFEVYELIE